MSLGYWQLLSSVHLWQSTAGEQTSPIFFTMDKEATKPYIFLSYIFLLVLRYPLHMQTIILLNTLISLHEQKFTFSRFIYW